MLIERETIDKDQFERLLAGEAEESVFAEPEKPSLEAPPEPERKPRAEPQPRPVPDPGRDDAAAASRGRGLTRERLPRAGPRPTRSGRRFTLPA